jgi:hypothetical protein
VDGAIYTLCTCVIIWVFLLFLQTYEKVATAFKLEEDVEIANVDADKYKDLAEK